jgi:hypothetical protein
MADRDHTHQSLALSEITRLGDQLNTDLSAADRSAPDT